MTDIEIARQVKMLPIAEIGKKLNIPEESLEFYGKYKAKVTACDATEKKGRLALVTAINPTPFGEGKTTVSIGLADAISRLGKRVALALREPSLGPVFGIKGGAAGGGWAQVVPMEDINLHFTGDFHAITSANNLLSALIDNHIKQGNALRLDVNRIEWKRCLDLNDRALRDITIGQGGDANGIPRKDGFNITAASEIMAILCLSSDLTDLKRRLSEIVIAFDPDGKPVTAGMLGAEESMAILLKDAIHPNLVQTLEHTPAFVHGGPFANIAHGCNSVRATNFALSYADYAVTEAGFGAELGAEKFLDIKCRAANLQPSCVVIVATARSLKYNGGAKEIAKEDLDALRVGLKNLGGHIKNMHEQFQLPTVVAINRFLTDTERELEEIAVYARSCGVEAFVTECWGKGGAGCMALAEKVVSLMDGGAYTPNYTYELTDTPQEKITKIATKIYGAKEVVFSETAQAKIAALDGTKYRNFPVCIAKTQYSFSDDAKKLGRPEGFTFTVRDVQLRAGSGFLVAICGNMLLMPGLPAVPNAMKMTIDADGMIEGLS